MRKAPSGCYNKKMNRNGRLPLDIYPEDSVSPRRIEAPETAGVGLKLRRVSGQKQHIGGNTAQIFPILCVALFRWVKFTCLPHENSLKYAELAAYNLARNLLDILNSRTHGRSIFL